MPHINPSQEGRYSIYPSSRDEVDLSGLVMYPVS